MGGVGLTSAQATQRLEQHGRNVVPEGPRVTWWQRLALQLRDPLIIVLLIAAVLTR